MVRSVELTAITRGILIGPRDLDGNVRNGDPRRCSRFGNYFLEQFTKLRGARQEFQNSANNQKFYCHLIGNNAGNRLKLER